MTSSTCSAAKRITSLRRVAITTIPRSSELERLQPAFLGEERQFGLWRRPNDLGYLSASIWKVDHKPESDNPSHAVGAAFTSLIWSWGLRLGGVR